jgi:hypothetical protein
LQCHAQQMAKGPDNQHTEHQNIITAKKRQACRNQSDANIAKSHPINANVYSQKHAKPDNQQTEHQNIITTKKTAPKSPSIIQ